MSKYLIAGGAGFIGSNIAEHLIKEGHYVRVLDNFFSGKKENLEFAKDLGKDKYELIEGDIRNSNDKKPRSSAVIVPASARIISFLIPAVPKV